MIRFGQISLSIARADAQTRWPPRYKVQIEVDKAWDGSRRELFAGRAAIHRSSNLASKVIRPLAAKIQGERFLPLVLGRLQKLLQKRGARASEFE